jgi:hypothetical protein
MVSRNQRRGARPDLVYAGTVIPERLRLPALFVAFSLPACATVEPPPTREQACHGTAINLDRVAAICASPARRGSPPPDSALDATVMPTPLHLQSGEDLQARVRLTNVSASPLDVDIGLDCRAFETRALREDGTVANLDEVEPAPQAACTPASSAQVRLEPGGWVEKAIAFRAVRTHLECSEPKVPCHAVAVGELEPGTYRLQVRLPFTDADPAAPRLAETLLEVRRGSR